MTKSTLPFDKQHFKKNVLAASDANNLLAWLCEEQCNLSNPHFDEMCQILIELHNSNQLNFIELIDSEWLESNIRHDFWSIQYLFTKLVPDLEVEVDLLISVVDRLITHAGEDMLANRPNSALREWLKRRPGEIAKLLERLKQGNDELLPNLTFVLEAGAAIDMKKYHSAAIELLADQRSLARHSAITALGRIDTTSDETLHVLGLQKLAHFIEKRKSEDEMAVAVRALLDNFARAQLIEEAEIIRLIELTSQNASPHLHHQLAMTLHHNHTSFNTPVKLSIILALGAADPSMKGVIKEIDYAFSGCIDSENRTAIAMCLQKFLNHPETPLQLSELEGFVHNLAKKNSDTFGWLVVHWLRSGNHASRLALPTLFRHFTKEEFELNVSLDEFDFSDTELVFVSRKTLGYLLVKPAMAASLLISFLRNVNEKNAAKEIAELLVDPLMINFPGQARDIVDQAAKTEDKAQKYLQAALEAHEKYLEGLSSMPKIRELWPSSTKRQVQAELQRKQISQSFKDAQSSSTFFNLIPKQVLLHGVGIVSYVHNKGVLQRTDEVLLSSLGTSVEVPRFEFIDPLHLYHLIFEFQEESFDS
ncbi:MAG: hypothetical protein F4073_05075 [Rhodobacteraceae bacterium]|nr:hypothetical protein [Paracoccaceae bacterium]MYF46298.1 hypothetical protein [Paracoccaceae bacterium]MYI91309.1 hypothetical protein [Paracoccaceae bacterium]